MVVDLYPLNVVTILDIYLLPNQDNIIANITKKKYFIIFDTLGFFY